MAKKITESVPLTFDKVAAEARKQFGENVIVPAYNSPPLLRVPTGRVMLDYITGGGIPANRMVLVVGHKSAHKTTGTLLVIREYLRCCCACLEYIDECSIENGCGAQDQSAKIIYLDVEGTFDKKWAIKVGVDLDRMHVIRPERGEHALDIQADMMQAKDVGFVVTDSLAALTPLSEVVKSHDDVIIAEQARLINRGTRKWVSAMNFRQNHGLVPIVFIAINQYRMRTDPFGGNPEIIPGGMAQVFASAVVIDQRTKGAMFPGKTFQGKVVPPYEGVDSEKPVKERIQYTLKFSKISVRSTVATSDMFIHDTPPFIVGDVDDADDTVDLAERFGLLSEVKSGLEFLGAPFKNRKKLITTLEEDQVLHSKMKRKLVRAICALDIDDESSAEPEQQAPLPQEG